MKTFFSFLHLLYIGAGKAKHFILNAPHNWHHIEYRSRVYLILPTIPIGIWNKITGGHAAWVLLFNNNNIVETKYLIGKGVLFICIFICLSLLVGFLVATYDQPIDEKPMAT